jgi:hypothetical protein
VIFRGPIDKTFHRSRDIEVLSIELTSFEPEYEAHSNQVQRIILVSIILVKNFSWNQTSISHINSSIKLNFNQSAKVNLKPLKRCVFWIQVRHVISKQWHYVRNLFRVRFPYLLLIRRLNLKKFLFNVIYTFYSKTSGRTVWEKRAK